ncbi:hypothetical protein [Bifidobacterium biavatii]|uniref:Alpha/beta hydrolase n=1 Tax=Bifidobacterium biavatii DSM 23969 TaxID=1437608 RepID=A0A086ZTF4_9BIFI|nr:hypothetical protein [Bifidobacterium biavatii]KFI49804.1 hypothetical protein BBIA_1494 [Bifidobacterium biavatii DSM 23969]
MIETTMGAGGVTPTCRMSAWRKNRTTPRQATKRVLLMPGTGYNCDRPLLYYAATALIENGWYADRLDVNADLSKTPAKRIFAMLDDAVDRWLEQVRADAGETDAPRTLVVGKSLSTFIQPHVADLGLPMALLTPVFSPADFDPARSVIPVPGDDDWHDNDAPKPLICAGTADPLYEPSRARRLSSLIHEYPGANHSIEIPGDWRTSMTYLCDVTDAVVEYAESAAVSAAVLS